MGEAGTGKTHLLTRVTRKLSHSNHILFVRKPNNEEAVAQHIWANIVNSLTRSLPTRGLQRSQLDDLLAHVFTRVLIPEFEQDIQAGKDAQQKQEWVDLLGADPFNLFSMLGEGERRQRNMDRIRRRTLRFLQLQHPEVDQTIAHALITYCFVVREDYKRILLTWLSGQDVDDADAMRIGLPSTWVRIDETSSEVATQQRREEQALRAIRSIAILSTYYQPQVLAFDQLEGLRDEPRLTRRWGDAVREIFTQAPNLLILTCIFPSLWDSWFKTQLDRSVQDRIASQRVMLETFQFQHGVDMLATYMAASFKRHCLPWSIYPFTESDVRALCAQADSPRTFLQAARDLFETWLAGTPVTPPPAVPDQPQIISQAAVDDALQQALDRFEAQERSAFARSIPVEHDFVGRVDSIMHALLKYGDEKPTFAKASCGNRVMPANFVLTLPGEEPLCIAVLYAEGNSFAARMRNFNAEMAARGQFTRAIILRDARCRPITGKVSREYIEQFKQMGGTYLNAERDEIALLSAIYETLVAIEEHDLCVGKHQIDKRQFVQFLRSTGLCRRSQLLGSAARQSAGVRRVISPSGEGRVGPAPEATPSGGRAAENVARQTEGQPPPKASQNPEAAGRRAPAVPIDVLLGDTQWDATHVGVLGTMPDDGRIVGISFARPQCLVLLGYMGSGKSYGLGVLVENALLQVANLTSHDRPLCAVAFNYRRNPEARFEYRAFRYPNNQPDEVARLRSEYGAEPAGIEKIHVFGYGPELRRRSAEYRDLITYPILFRPQELSAQHWEILLKPPRPQAEYMDVVRDIIQRLFYQERLTLKNLETAILCDERLSSTQRQKAETRLSFARRWLRDERSYEWADVLTPGVLNVFDLRMQTMTGVEALKLCLIISDLVRRTKNGVNKVIVYDEAHEYVDCKELVGELENAITQMRHDGLSFILASQFPERIPATIFKYLLTRMVFKLPNRKAIEYVRNATPNLASLSPQAVSNLDLEEGHCFIQTDDQCSDMLLKVPQRLRVRPRCTMHGGGTMRA
jgi:hypothetical protein